MAKTFEIQNPDALANAIANLEDSLAESTLRKAAAASATVFKNEVFRYVPRDTWDLAKGLTVAFLPEDSVTGKIATYEMVFVGDTKPKGKRQRKVSRRALAGWLENGTSKKAARPFVRPSFEAAKERAAEAGQAEITKALKAKG
jgi:hypothetical protein